MLSEYECTLLEFLLPMVNEKRLSLLRKMIDLRTRYITVALEDIYQSQNASAVLRTCDCFGIQDIHIIENRNTYELNPDVELGAAQWLTLRTYSNKENNTKDAISHLKGEGYRIVATSPHTNTIKLEDLDISGGKIAFLFGTELSGLSNIALDNADEFLTIPMMGFTESFNISVSAGIVLHQVNSMLRTSGIDWALSHEEKDQLLLTYVKNSVKNAAIIENGFKKRFYS